MRVAFQGDQASFVRNILHEITVTVNQKEQVVKKVQDYQIEEGSHIRGLKAVIFECDYGSC